MKKENVVLKIWRIIYPIGIHFGISQIVTMGIAFVVMFQISFESIQNGDQLDVTQVTAQLIGKIAEYTLHLTLGVAVITIPIILIFYKRDKKRQFFQGEKSETLHFIDFILILLLSVSSCLALNNLITVSNIAHYSKVYQEVSKLLFSGGLLLQILAVGIFAPIVEELVFRGLVYKRLKEYKSPLFGMLFSSFLFGLYHMNIVQGLYAFILGLILAYLMEKYKSVKAPILAHMGANILAVLLTKYSVLERNVQSELAFWTLTIASTVVTIVLLIWLKKKKFTDEMNG